MLQKQDIKPFSTENFAVEITDYDKGFFIIKNLETGQKSETFTNKTTDMVLECAYKALRDAYSVSNEIFDTMCQKTLNTL